MPSRKSVARHTALSLRSRPHVGENVHAREVHPDEERLSALACLVMKSKQAAGGFIVDGFHALSVSGPVSSSYRRRTNGSRHEGIA